MPMNDTQFQLVKDWLQSKAPNLHCPACASYTLEIERELIAPAVLGYAPDQGSKVSKREVSPMVVIVCHQCGYVQFFSSIRIGLHLT